MSIAVFTDFEYLNAWMAKQWQMHLASPETDMTDFFVQLGGYEGLAKVKTSLEFNMT